jgi:hypothetical protein
MRRRWIRAASLTAFLLLFPATPAPGQDPEAPSEGMRLLERGKVLFGEGCHEEARRRFAAALRAFEQADDPGNAASACAWIARCQEESGDLSPFPTARDDGFLKLIDLLEHWRDRLHGCELVVLSACETHRGPTQQDEAPFALPVGFMYAGCPSVIASLWRVDDQSTADLFSDFYQRLERSEGRDKLKAFTEARQALRKKYPEPYFWAPFIYIGGPR